MRAPETPPLPFLTGSAVIVTYSGEATQLSSRGHIDELQRALPHGVGRRGAHDQGGNVTNFRRNKCKYARAEPHNSDLDRDNDRIACEKA